MPQSASSHWSEQLRQTLQRYDVSLARHVCERLLKPRSQWPIAELIERSVAAVGNAAVIDRRVQSLPAGSRRVLALIGHSRQPRWRLGSLLELLYILEGTADIQPVLALFETGLLFPELPLSVTRFKDFEQWLGLGAPGGPAVFAHPDVTARARGEDLGLPQLSAELRVLSAEYKKPHHSLSTQHSGALSTIHEADGLEWPLRLAVVWQQVAAGSLRRTQQGDFFKRDLDRLRADPLLNAPPADSLAELPDTALLAVELALIEGLLHETGGELSAAARPPAWEQGLHPTLESLWAALPCLDTWNGVEGWTGRHDRANPFPSAQLLVLLLLARLPHNDWADPAAIAQWVVEHHPYWTVSEGSSGNPREGHGKKTSASKAQSSALDPRTALVGFLLGFAYQLRMLQAAREGKGPWRVRLSPLGRWLLGLADAPAAVPAYPQTLLVQPNLEIIAYRQGLTPALIARLGQFAAWKNLGSACTLQLQPESVYRALEAGESFESIRQTLEQHGMRATPPAVIESLRTWSNKRERLGVYPAATLFEFATAEDLNEALARGLPGLRLTERLAVVVDENAIDFRHFRLTGTRDYGLPPEQCVAVEPDGVTLSIDVSKSDLLLETELQRFAEPAPSPYHGGARAAPYQGGAQGGNGRCQYRLTPASLAAALNSGLGLSLLEDWFLQRTGRPLTPAARLLLTGSQLPPLELRPQLVLHVSGPETADGLMQWPQTRGLIRGRLGPTALVVDEEKASELRQQLAALGLKFHD